jgi:phosphoribosylformylglycinamidine cyclo-ligase
MADKTTRYADLGVDAGKQSVRSTFTPLIDNDFPGAFVNIVRDADPDFVFTQHGDGDGSKGINRLVAYLETGDPTWLGGAVDDAVAMNMGDIAASGFLHNTITWTNNLNVGLAPTQDFKQVLMQAFASRFAELKRMYEEAGFHIKFLGGETADLPDQVSGSVFDVTVHAREPEENIITGNVQPGDVIYGFASDGKARWEDASNSGIMSNGLTLAGTCLGWSGYSEKYPNLRLKNLFRGKYTVGATDPLLQHGTVFEALLSPTRQWPLVIKCLVDQLAERNILHMLHGISMNTGGGATKIGHVGTGIHYVKEMPTPPPIFRLIQREGDVSWREMYQAFNCGVGLDVVGTNHNEFAEAVRAVVENTNVVAYPLGITRASESEANTVTLCTQFGRFANY